MNVCAQLKVDVHLTPADIATRPGNLVVSINVGEVRSHSLDVQDDPWPEGIPQPLGRSP